MSTWLLGYKGVKSGWMCYWLNCLLVCCWLQKLVYLDHAHFLGHSAQEDLGALYLEYKLSLSAAVCHYKELGRHRLEKKTGFGIVPGLGLENLGSDPDYAIDSLSELRKTG